MTKKKVTMAYIADDSARKATFKKRRRGILKKVNELSTLCGIDACAILYGPQGEPEPEVFPEPPEGPDRVLARFEALNESDKAKKMLTHEGLLRQRIAKATRQLRRVRRDNRARELLHLMHSGLGAPLSPDGTCPALESLSVADLNSLRDTIDKTLAEVNKQMEKFAVKEEPVDAVEEAAKAETGLEDVTWELPWFMEWSSENEEEERHDDDEDGDH